MNLIIAITNVMSDQRPFNLLLPLTPQKNIGAFRVPHLYNLKGASFYLVSLTSSVSTYPLHGNLRITLPIPTDSITFPDTIPNKGGHSYEKIK